MPVVAKTALSRWHDKKNKRKNYEHHWQCLAELLDPVRAVFTTDRSAGENPMSDVFDSTPMIAARGLAAAVDGLLKPKTDRWFFMALEDDRDNNNEDVIRWREETERMMYRALYYPPAGFQYRSGQTDRSLVIYGQGALYIGENLRENRLEFRSVYLKNFWFDVDGSGNVIRTFTLEKFTVEQFRREFGKEVNPRCIVDAEKSDSKKTAGKMFSFLHVIEPRDDYLDGGLSERGKPYQSGWIDIEAEEVFSHGSYHEMPYVVPRWDTPEESELAFGPGTMALPDCQTLNEMMRSVIEQSHKALDPAIFYPDDSLFEAARTYPGSMNAYDFSFAERARGNPFFTLPVGDISVGIEMISAMRESVFNAFFRNVLNLPVDSPEMTATEVLQRQSEMVRQIGPVFSRLEAEYTARIVDRVYRIMLRRNVFPEPPDRVVGKQFDFQFRSAVTAAREMMDVAAYAKSLNDLAPLIEAKPELVDNIEGDTLFRGVWTRNGSPSDWLARSRDIAAIRDQRAQAAQDEASLEAAQQVAGAAKDMGIQVGQ